MLPKELFAKVKHIEITTSRLVNTTFAGEYHSVFKGKGMEFHEVREYTAGDDVRDIDWNVTAKTGTPHTKKFVEERELTVMLMVDVSASEYFGTHARTKSEVTAEIAALLAFAAIKNNDRVGALFFTDEVEKYIPPKKGQRHVLRVVREILSFKPRRKGTNLNIALRALNDILSKSATVFLFSDFFAEDYQKLLKVSHKKHDMVAVIVEDKKERNFPSLGVVNLCDVETGESVLFHSGRRSFIRKFSQVAEKRRSERRKLFDSINLDYIELASDESYVKPLIRFFKEREKKARFLR